MNKKSYIFLSLFIFIIFTLLQFITLSPKEDLRIYFLDVGQGDSALIQYPTRERLLIDTGKDSKIFRELDKVVPWYDTNIDYVLLTHGDLDHVGVMLDIFDRYSIKTLFVHEFFAQNEDELEKQIIQKAKNTNVKIEILKEGDVITIGAPVVNSFKILHPDTNCMIIFNDSNNCSLVGLLTYGEHNFLFTGDIGKEVEQKISASITDSVDVLKIAHHGSKNSTDELFISKIKPTYSIISVGENSYGHPAPEVIEVLSKNNSTIFNTKELATIVASSDGSTIKVRQLFDQAGFFQSGICTILLYGFDTSC